MLHGGDGEVMGIMGVAVVLISLLPILLVMMVAGKEAERRQSLKIKKKLC